MTPLTPAGQFLDRFLLALCVWREARGETDRGMRMVADVICNRVKDNRWPHTIADVVLQPWQFSSFNANDPNAVRFPHDADLAWDRAVDAADGALDAFLPVPNPPLTLANHYHVQGLMPEWADPSRVVDVEGHHVFYQL